MIFSSIYAKDDSSRYPKALQTAIEYLKSHDITAMEPGVYELQGREIYVLISDAQTAPLEEKRPESHERYIDVQFLASGLETIGFTPDTGTYQVSERKEEKDVIFYERVDHESFVHAVPGCYSIFFPNDIHRPAVMTKEPMVVRKAVVKVSVDLL